MVPPGSALPVVAVSCAPMTQVTRVATCTTAVLLSVWTLSAQQKPKTRRIFMSVVDPANKPVLDLTAADFQIKENQIARTVASAVVNQPQRIALMVDNSAASKSALTPLRAGILAFIDAIPANDEIMLLTTGRQLRVRVAPTTDHKKLKDAVGIIYPDDGSPSVLFSGLTETFNRFYRNVPNRWATFVILTTDGPENSNMNPKQFSQLVDALNAREVRLHGIRLTGHGMGAQSDATLVLAQNSGGHIDTLSVPNALPERLKALGELIAQESEQLSRQYQIEYDTDATDLQSTIEVIISRVGLRPIVFAGRLK